MMQKRTLYSLLIISFIVVFAASVSLADTVVIQSKSNLPRCAAQQVNVTANVTTAEVSAVECVFEITTASGCGFINNVAVVWPTSMDGKLSERFIDLTGCNGVAPDTIRFAAMRVDDGDGVLAAGNNQLIAQINFNTVDCCTGSAKIDNIVFNYPNPTCQITTQFVDAADGAVLPVTVVASTIGIANQAPSITAVPDQTLHWGQTLNYQLVGSDPDACEALTYSKLSGPAALAITSAGKITWNTVGADVCTHQVVVAVTDKCGAQKVDTFAVCVQNTEPAITNVPAPAQILWGETYAGAVVANDPDAGPNPLLYTLLSFAGANSTTINQPVVNPATGEVTWETENLAAYSGLYTICVKVTDAANLCDPCSPKNADTACFTVNIVQFRVSIAKLHGTAANHYAGVIQGTEAEVPVTIEANYPIGGFDLLMAYDPTGLSFMSATEGAFLNQCAWEYFTYRQGANGNCGTGCPSGLVRVVAMAETNNGPHHPICFTPNNNELFVLHFMVTNDRTFECMFVPVKFFWVDCGDNGISSQGGDTLLIAKNIYDYNGLGFDQLTGTDTEASWTEVTDFSKPMPSYTGPTAPDCNTSFKYTPVRWIDYRNGGVDIICGDEIDAVGDINLNGIAYEVADAVMFTNYFINGLAAFGSHVDGSTAASDANKDGVVLTVADLVYVIRVVIGDAVPYAKTDVVNASFSQDGNVLNVGAPMAAAHLIFAGENANVELLVNSGVAMEKGSYDGQTHVIIYPNAVNGTFSGDFLRSDAKLVKYEFATYEGQNVAAKLVPKHFTVAQNYPNPFNPTTTIEFALPTAGAWAVDVYNVNGQIVWSKTGSSEAGIQSVEWDASNNASGVYFYRVSAGQNSMTKKAILLK